MKPLSYERIVQITNLLNHLHRTIGSSGKSALVVLKNDVAIKHAAKQFSAVFADGRNMLSTRQVELMDVGTFRSTYSFKELKASKKLMLLNDNSHDVRYKLFYIDAEACKPDFIISADFATSELV